MKSFISAAAAVALISPFAFGADSAWISTSSTDWSIAGNWSAGVPGATIGSIFTDSATIQRTLNLGTVQRTSQGIQFSLFAGGAGFTFMSSGTPIALQLRNGGTANGIINNDDSAQLFNVPIALYTSSGFAGGAQTWNAAVGDLVVSGLYSGSAVTVALGGASGRLTIDGAFNTTIGTTGRGDITGIGAGLTKNGAGTLTLGGTVANSYSGANIINQGTVVAAKANAFGNGAGALQFLGGTLRDGGFNQAFGVLSLGNVAVTLDMSGGTHALTFANSAAASWAGGAELDIIGWNSTDSLRFGTDATGLTAAQISQIKFTDLEGVYATGLDASGFLTVVPEPSAVTLSLIGGFGLALTLIYRRKKA